MACLPKCISQRRVFLPKAVFRPQSVAAHFPLMIAFQGHPDKGTERVDMGLFLIKAYIGGWYDSKSFPTVMCSVDGLILLRG